MEQFFDTGVRLCPHYSDYDKIRVDVHRFIGGANFAAHLTTIRVQFRETVGRAACEAVSAVSMQRGERAKGWTRIVESFLWRL